MKKSSKYDETISVSWRDILKGLKFTLSVREMQAKWSIESVDRDIDHHYPELLDDHLRKALLDCEQVFFYDNLIRSLRDFLRYRHSTKQRQDIQFCYDFYSKYKKIPCRDGLAASSTGWHCDNR